MFISPVVLACQPWCAASALALTASQNFVSNVYFYVTTQQSLGNATLAKYSDLQAAFETEEPQDEEQENFVKNIQVWNLSINDYQIQQ